MQTNHALDNRKQHYAYIDALKALGIFLVIIGHFTTVKNASDIYVYIYSFHMFLFYFSSGLVQKDGRKIPLRKTVKNLFFRLYIPYVVFALLQNAQDFIKYFSQMHGIADILKRFGLILATLLFGTNYVFRISLGAAWFLISLFTVKFLYTGLQKITNDKKWILLTVSFTLFILAFILNGFNKLPFSLLPSCAGMLFFAIGDVFKPVFHKIGLQKHRWAYIFLGLGLSVGCFFVCKYCDREVRLIDNLYPNNFFLYIIAAVLGLFGLYFISVACSAFQPLQGFFRFFGSNSLIIMGTHGVLRVVLFAVAERIVENAFAQSVIVFVGTLVLSVPICILMNKYFPLLCGAYKPKVKDK